MPDFNDFDDKGVYDRSQSLALDHATRNFVVEFAKENAHIAFNLNPNDVQELLSTVREPRRPVRWINIWGPNKQPDIVDQLAAKYKFSPRLLAVIKTTPRAPKPRVSERRAINFRTRSARKADIEANASFDSSRLSSPIQSSTDTSHYTIAKQMIHYHSIDVGPRFLCIGANWMHELSRDSLNYSIIEEGMQQPLWSWLVLCDDNTVISLHEDPGPVTEISHIQSMRNNTISVMSQLSNHGHLTADPISIQSVRQALDPDSLQSNVGVEGASNLFYYLFDDWRAAYTTISAFRHRLEELQEEILEDMARRSNSAPNIEIIPRLHILGRRLRQMQHLYEGYKNLTLRILDPNSATTHPGVSTPRTFTGLSSGARGVVLAQSASTRFERLGDRLHLLMLSETEEFLAEKDALINTYFNINAQKDSESTARLTRSATLLAKLSVLFLPVSLMTAYFSVQIQELNNYTSKDYWYTFAVIMSISILALFFFSRLLMYVTETLDTWVKLCGLYFTKTLFRRKLKKEEEVGHEK